MLVLSRKVNEQIQIGESITVTVVRLASGSVRLGIDAPDGVSVLRGELVTGQSGRLEAQQRTLRVDGRPGSERLAMAGSPD